MVPSDKPMATSYRPSIVTMSLSAAVWSQFSMECFKLLNGRISETVRDRATVTINH